MKTRRFGHATHLYRNQYLHVMGHLAGTSPGIESWEKAKVSRRRREAEWDEGIPNNPKVRFTKRE